jgi:hypothetical protein
MEFALSRESSPWRRRLGEEVQVGRHCRGRRPGLIISNDPSQNDRR